jgi:hypothetical protein
MILANYMFIGRRLTQINADKIIENLRSSALICGLTNIKKPAQQRATLIIYKITGPDLLWLWPDHLTICHRRPDRADRLFPFVFQTT